MTQSGRMLRPGRTPWQLSPDQSRRIDLEGRRPPGHLSFLVLSSLRRTVMETETLGIVLATVLPLYPMLFAIYQKIGKYDEVVEEFKKLRDEHEQCKEEYHGF